MPTIISSGATHLSRNFTPEVGLFEKVRLLNTSLTQKSEGI
jgi:hypothetical protein